MSNKPIKPRVTEDGDDYLVDALMSVGGAELPPVVKVALRHFLVAAELGDLVVCQCTDTSTDAFVYLLCARVETETRKYNLLPITRLGDPAKLLQGIRPPAIVSTRDFVMPKYVVDMSDIGVTEDAYDLDAPSGDDNVH